jgi:hypothetical protein
MQPAIKAQESQEQEQPQLVAGTERGAQAAGIQRRSYELEPQKEAQCAIDWHKPPKRAQKRQFWLI